MYRDIQLCAHTEAHTYRDKHKYKTHIYRHKDTQTYKYVYTDLNVDTHRCIQV